MDTLDTLQEDVVGYLGGVARDAWVPITELGMYLTVTLGRPARKLHARLQQPPLSEAVEVRRNTATGLDECRLQPTAHAREAADPLATALASAGVPPDLLPLVAGLARATVDGPRTLAGVGAYLHAHATAMPGPLRSQLERPPLLQLFHYDSVRDTVALTDRFGTWLAERAVLPATATATATPPPPPPSVVVAPAPAAAAGFRPAAMPASMAPSPASGPSAEREVRAVVVRVLRDEPGQTMSLSALGQHLRQERVSVPGNLLRALQTRYADVVDTFVSASNQLVRLRSAASAAGWPLPLTRMDEDPRRHSRYYDDNNVDDDDDVEDDRLSLDLPLTKLGDPPTPPRAPSEPAAWPPAVPTEVTVATTPEASAAQVAAYYEQAGTAAGAAPVALVVPGLADGHAPLLVWAWQPPAAATLPRLRVHIVDLSPPPRPGPLLLMPSGSSSSSSSSGSSGGGGTDSSRSARVRMMLEEGRLGALLSDRRVVKAVHGSDARQRLAALCVPGPAPARVVDVQQTYPALIGWLGPSLAPGAAAEPLMTEGEVPVGGGVRLARLLRAWRLRPNDWAEWEAEVQRGARGDLWARRPLTDAMRACLEAQVASVAAIWDATARALQARGELTTFLENMVF
jgi:hypothetical protein